MHTQYLIAFTAYIVCLLLIAYLSHRRQTSAAEFIVGSRSLNFWLTALSAHASDMSNWLFMGYPAAIFVSGVDGSWIAFSLILGMFINWQFVAKRLRTETEQYKSYTLSTFFEKRLNDTTGLIRPVTAIMTVFFITWYLTAGLIGMGILFESVFGINYFFGISIAVAVVVIYTFYGGYVTVAWTDLVQGLFLLACILIVPAVAINALPNGLHSIAYAAKQSGISLNPFDSMTSDRFWKILFSMSWGLGYWGQPHILTKFMGIRNVSEINKAKYVGMTWQILSLIGATLVGLVAIAFFYHEAPISPQLIFIEMVKVLFHPLAAGFLLSAIIAATMSTMDSQILVAASVLSEDLYKRLFRRSASERELVVASRIGVLLVALTALLLAFTKSSIMDTVQYAWSGLGASFGPLLLVSLYSDRVTPRAGITAIAIGGITAAFWHLLNTGIDAMIPAFFFSLAAALLLRRPR